MAASLSLTQLSSGNPVYDKYYRQVDPSGSGRVAAADAALFLKRCGLSDLVLGKIWDLADSERKGFLNKQQFFVALRLVACAQNGLEVAFKSLNVAVPPPNFQDTSSPLLPGAVPVDSPWVVKPEEKLKFDAIFDSLSPVGGMLTGDKVKPVLLNSKLPVDVLGRVWELSDIDRDGMLDKDEFAVAMYLVYRALENEPVPVALPPSLVPPSKRKKWVVSSADKAKYDELFIKTDSDMDGLVSGPEVRDIFLKTGLPSATLARIWELCDIGDIGKLTREQFALALYLINQKLSKGIDPPQTLSPEMIPPSDRLARQNNAVSCQAADFSAIKELDSLSNEIMDLQREKSSVEQEIKEKEESIRERTSEVQDLQDEVQKESEELRRLQTERQEVQEALERLDEQKSSLEEQLKLIRQQCSQENQLIQSLQVEHSEQEQRIGDYEDELVRAREELLRLQEETRSLGEKVRSARAQLCPLQDAVTESHTQIAQVSLYNRMSVGYIGLFWCSQENTSSPAVVESEVREAEEEVKQQPTGIATKVSTLTFLNRRLFSSFSLQKLQKNNGQKFCFKNVGFKSSSANFPTGDPFASSDPFNSNTACVFCSYSRLILVCVSDPFATVFGNESFGGGFADFSSLAKVNFIFLLQFRENSSLSLLYSAMLIVAQPGPSVKLFIINMLYYPTEEDMIEWAKRESEREERERVARLTQQEQEDLELAIALSKSELS
uniref:Epidermal growth factor receptor pathway substrate 15 n=1 Tax=Pygocentrus nattereri TaxID=42514 RepID=A0AAR2LQM6_PYGNA